MKLSTFAIRYIRQLPRYNDSDFGKKGVMQSLGCSVDTAIGCSKGAVTEDEITLAATFCLMLKIYIPSAERWSIEGVRRNMAIDPVCKMTVDEKTAKIVSEYKGRKYYFCALSCKNAFDENPAKYAGAGNPSPARRGCGCGCR